MLNMHFIFIAFMAISLLLLMISHTMTLRKIEITKKKHSLELKMLCFYQGEHRYSDEGPQGLVLLRGDSTFFIIFVLGYFRKKCQQFLSFLEKVPSLVVMFALLPF